MIRWSTVPLYFPRRRNKEICTQEPHLILVNYERHAQQMESLKEKLIANYSPKINTYLFVVMDFPRGKVEHTYYCVYNIFGFFLKKLR